jgi:nitrite reductase (NADH) small subunit
MGFVRAAGISEIPAGKIAEVKVSEKCVALANVGGKFYAISGICLHQGGPLGEGELDGAVVMCPWHGWQFDVTTGKVAANQGMGVETYAVEVRGNDVFINVG